MSFDPMADALDRALPVARTSLTQLFIVSKIDAVALPALAMKLA